MKKNTKYILVSSSILMGILGFNIKVSAAPNKVSSFFASLCGGKNCFKSSEPSHDILKNLKIDSDLKAMAKILAEEGSISGINLNKFDLKNVSEIFKNKYYHQKELGDGSKVTLVSESKPKLDDIDGNYVKISYKNNDGRDLDITSSGLQLWIKGEDLIKKYNENLKKLDTSKIKVTKPKTVDVATQTRKVSIVSNSSDVSEDLSNYGVSSEIFKEDGNNDPSLATGYRNVDSSMYKTNPMFGANVQTFDFEDVEDINPSLWYHQYKTSNGETVTLIATKEPTLNYKVTGFMDPNKKILASKYAYWISGKDLIEEKSKRVS